MMDKHNMAFFGSEEMKEEKENENENENQDWTFGHTFISDSSATPATPKNAPPIPETPDSKPNRYNKSHSHSKSGSINTVGNKNKNKRKYYDNQKNAKNNKNNNNNKPAPIQTKHINTSNYTNSTHYSPKSISISYSCSEIPVFKDGFTPPSVVVGTGETSSSDSTESEELGIYFFL